ncbi:MAG TPA: hypothetical protein VI488_19340 [Candidatus Angelobacter sp.]
MRKAVWVCLAVLVLSSLLVAQDEPKRGPSTPEERQRFVAITRKLEQTPLDKSLYAEKKWALDWIGDIPDINVTVCPQVLGEDFLNSRYRYMVEVMGQVVFGNVVFLIEHPDKKGDNVAQYTAGVESALKAYKGILKADPLVSRALEELLEKQNQGKLTDFVRETSKACQSGDQVGF